MSNIPFDKCSEFYDEKRKEVICRDNKSRVKYIYQNKSTDSLTKYIVDGCLIQGEQKRCDYLLVNNTKKICYFIEIKGSDIIKAVEQIDNSLELLKNYLNEYIINARIVLTRINTIDLHNSKINRLKIKLKNYKGDLIYKCEIYEEAN